MFLLLIIIAFAGYAAAIFGVVLLVFTMVIGILLLCTKQDDLARPKRKAAFRALLKAFLVVLCVVACMAALVYVLGSQVTFSM